MKRLLIFALAGVTLLVTTGLILLSRGGITTRSAEPTPYTATLLHSDQTVSVASLQGQTVLLSSWATWCVECRHELPSLELLWESRKDRGLLVVAVNLDVDGTNPAIDTMIRTTKLTMPIWHDPDNNYSNFVSAPGVPTSVLLNARGEVQKIWFGRTEFQDLDVLAVIDNALESERSVSDG